MRTGSLMLNLFRFFVYARGPKSANDNGCAFRRRNRRTIYHPRAFKRTKLYEYVQSILYCLRTTHAVL